MERPRLTDLSLISDFVTLTSLRTISGRLVYPHVSRDFIVDSYYQKKFVLDFFIKTDLQVTSIPGWRSKRVEVRQYVNKPSPTPYSVDLVRDFFSA